MGSSKSRPSSPTRTATDDFDHERQVATLDYYKGNKHSRGGSRDGGWDGGWDSSVIISQMRTISSPLPPPPNGPPPVPSRNHQSPPCSPPPIHPQRVAQVEISHESEPPTRDGLGAASSSEANELEFDSKPTHPPPPIESRDYATDDISSSEWDEAPVAPTSYRGGRLSDLKSGLKSKSVNRVAQPVPPQFMASSCVDSDDGASEDEIDEMASHPITPPSIMGSGYRPDPPSLAPPHISPPPVVTSNPDRPPPPPPRRDNQKCPPQKIPSIRAPSAPSAINVAAVAYAEALAAVVRK